MTELVLAFALSLPASSPLTLDRLGPPSPSRPDLSGHVPRGFRRAMAQAVLESGLPEPVLARLIQSESSWRPGLVVGPLVNGSYDLGVAGWNSKWLSFHREAVGFFDPMKPSEAIPAAARWLAALTAELGSLERAVVAWKSGAGHARRRTEPAWVRELAREIVRPSSIGGDRP